MKSLMHQGSFSSLKAKTKAYMDAQRRQWYTFLAAMTTAAAATVPTFCAPTMKNIFMSMVNIIYDLALYLGAGILLFALIKWISSMMDENPEGQSRAIKTAIVGVALICFKAFAGPIVNSIFE